MSTKISIQHLAKLSNLPVSAEEAAKFESQLEETLETIAQLDEVDTSKVEPTSQVTGMTNVFREDKIDQSRILTQEAALSNAKKTHKGYFVVPAVISS